MNRIFEITIHPMGDVAPRVIPVFYSKQNDEYELGFSKSVAENPKVKFTDGRIVQTVGTPLDSNTLHSISEQIQNI